MKRIVIAFLATMFLGICFMYVNISYQKKRITMIDSEQIQKLLDVDEKTEDKDIEVMKSRDETSVQETELEVMDVTGSIRAGVRESVTGLRYWYGDTKGLVQEEQIISQVWEYLSQLHYVEEDIMGDEQEGIWLDFITDKEYISVVVCNDKVCLEDTWYRVDEDITDTVRYLIARAELDEGAE